MERLRRLSPPRIGPRRGDGARAGHVLVVPGNALVVLVGPPGAGKSTFAARHFRSTEILSSDTFRAMVADDPADQRATPAAFDLLHRAAHHRLARARLTVVDATNLGPGDRRGLLDLAREHGRPAVAIVFALPEPLVQERNRSRADRVVDADVVARGAMRVRTLAEQSSTMLAEGFRAVHVLRDPVAIEHLRLAREGRPTRTRMTARPAGPRDRTS